MINPKSDYNYFASRNPGKIYVSKAFRALHFNKSMISTEKRFIKKVFVSKPSSEFTNIDGEIVLRELPISKFQINAVVYTNKDKSIMEFILQKFVWRPDNTLEPTDLSFSFTQEEFTNLLKFLSDLKFIDFTNKERFIIDDKTLDNNKILINLNPPNSDKVLVEVDKDLNEIFDKLSHLKASDKNSLLEVLKNNVLTKSDIDIITGRKDGLKEFKQNLIDTSKLSEPEWQNFFKQNDWIFGYGLEYRFLSILQKEASVSSIDLDGKNEVKSDYLLATKNFTVIVELKRPDTQLFERDKNRSESWRLSKDLTYAISQILTQKAEWEINSQHKNFDENGFPITQTTIDPKTFLIIGHSEQFNGTNKEDLIKRKTFELYRRNSKNIEIITYDELLERAKFIVNDSNEENLQIEDDGLPF